MSLPMQLLGMVLLITGAAVLWGLGWALIVAGGCALALGVALEVGQDGMEDEPDGARETADA